MARGRHAILIYGYEYEGWPLDPVIAAFECLAGQKARLGERVTASFHRTGSPYP